MFWIHLLFLTLKPKNQPLLAPIQPTKVRLFCKITKRRPVFN
nr:MAG TPA: hypothetical protein [Caudoviricetes sp.]